ncbi:MAG: ATP-binding cassette domain-containing protein [Malacoplasma sp.]|nr:ATP-binding cassette domain-containing protein [Malacoplasma sp.]
MSDKIKNKKEKIVNIYRKNIKRFFGNHYNQKNISVNEQEKLQEVDIEKEKNKKIDNVEKGEILEIKDNNTKKENLESKSGELKEKKNKVNNVEKRLIKEIQKLNKKHKGPKNIANTLGYIVELKDTSKKFTNGYIINDVLKDINLSIKEGQFVVFLGKSGSGKTTLMNIMSGLNRATIGTTIVNGFNLINLSNSELTNFRRNYIGYIFQEYGLLSTLNVYENVLAGFNLNPENKDKKIIDDILKEVNLFDHKKKYPAELSGGQQQRVAIARAIAKNPRIIFGDEPTGAVDTKMSEIILTVLKKVNREKGTTIIIITHDSKIAQIANVVYTISNGVITSVKEVKNPLEPKDIFHK